MTDGSDAFEESKTDFSLPLQTKKFDDSSVQASIAVNYAFVES